MADDPNRDILPVKEGSCPDTIISTIDIRERHLICKLDRYQLEDKYLRLLDEANNLKKLSNCQEDKIKRLGTKLIRLASNPRSCGLALDVADDRNRISALEFENAKLKEKIIVMRNQLLSHTISGRSTSRNRNLTRPTSSGLITCRSENTRARAPSCQCSAAAGDSDDARNYLAKIEKLEAQKKDMACRISELEKELALCTDNQKEKVAENVEYIRVWRQMKQLNDKLIMSQEKNSALTAEINDLKTTLKQTTRNNQEIAAVLTSERSRIAEIDEHILKVKTSSFTIREKDEQIRDLMSEIKILQQHNGELITLTTKYGHVEVENVELRKKLSDQINEQQTLKIAFNNEQANISALQIANGQLLSKLEGLQATIDTLTIQLRSLNKNTEKCDAIIQISPSSFVSTTSKKFTEQCAPIEQCKKCCELYDTITQLEKNTVRQICPVDKSIQTLIVNIRTREQGTMVDSEDEEEICSQVCKKAQEDIASSILSREKILKLLDQARINTPLDASRITSEKESCCILDASQRHSSQEISSRMLRDESNLVQPSLQKRIINLKNSNMTLSQILLVLFNALQEYMSNNPGERIPNQINVDSFIDVNNNNTADIKQDDNRDSTMNSDYVRTSDKDCMTSIESCCVHESVQTNDCTCNNVKDCYKSLKPNGRCTVCSSSPPSVTCTKDCESFPCKKISPTISLKDISSVIQDSSLFPKISEKCKKSSYRDISNDFSVKRTIKKMKTFKSPRYPRCNLACHLRKVKESTCVQEKQKLPCKIECLKLTESPKESFPLLISDRQGLVEIHISRLQLSTSIAKIPEEEDICNLCIFISWDIWGEKTAYTPKMKCPDLTFNSSSVYRIADLFTFFKNVLSEYLVFRVNIVRQDDTCRMLARAKVSIKDILDYPQNKLHYIVPVNSVISCFFGVNFGQLSLWVRLSCNVDMVEAFKKQCGITSLRDINHIPPDKKDTVDTTVPPDAPTTLEEIKDAPVDTNSEVITTCDKKFEENETIKVKSPETSDEEANSKEGAMMEFKTLLANGNSLLKGANNTLRDLSEILSESTWEKYKQKALLSFTRNKTDEQDYHHDTSICDKITIEIVSISLFPENSVIEDDEIQLLYVEFSFLGHRGEEMETISVSKPKIPNQEVFYNFKKEFQIDEQTHAVERESLQAMLSEIINPNIKFIIISEPIPEETEIKECEDIGYATFNVKKYVYDENKNLSLLIKDNRNKPIGILKINVSGLDNIECLQK